MESWIFLSISRLLKSSSSLRFFWNWSYTYSAGVSGSTKAFISDKSTPESATIGDALFSQSTFDQWTKVFQTNTFAPFFVTTGFLSLLEKGARSREGETSSVINISSCVGNMKISMTSVSCIFLILTFANPVWKFIYGVSKAGVDHLTTTMATEFALNKIPVRVNCIAPGAFPSQTTGAPEVLEKFISRLPGAINPVPALRAGRSVSTRQRPLFGSSECLPREHEIGMAAVFLSSSAGEYTNGVILRMDGGLALVNP